MKLTECQLAVSVVIGRYIIILILIISKQLNPSASVIIIVTHPVIVWTVLASHHHDEILLHWFRWFMSRYLKFRLRCPLSSAKRRLIMNHLLGCRLLIGGWNRVRWSSSEVLWEVVVREKFLLPAKRCSDDIRMINWGWYRRIVNVAAHRLSKRTLLLIVLLNVCFTYNLILIRNLLARFIILLLESCFIDILRISFMNIQLINILWLIFTETLFAFRFLIQQLPMLLL